MYNLLNESFFGVCDSNLYARPRRINMVNHFVYSAEGPAINPIINDGEEPLPSLSDWHDYEPNLEFDDTELTHPATTNGK